MVEVVVSIRDANGALLREFTFPAPSGMFVQEARLQPLVHVSVRMTREIAQLAVPAFQQTWKDECR